MTATNLRKHLRAARFTAIIAAFTIPPVYWLAYLYANDVTKDLRDDGPVPAFTFVTDDGQSVFSKNETFRRVSLLTSVPQACQAACQVQVRERLMTLVTWSAKHLRNDNKHDPKPQDIGFIVFSQKPLAPLPPPVQHISLAAHEKFLLPATSTVDPNQPLFTVISQESHFRAVLPALADDTDEKLRRLLAKLTSQTYLLHYLTMQNLMWKKAKDYARGN